MFFDPGRDLVVRGAGGNEMLEFFGADAGGLKKFLVHGAAVHEIALPADKRGAAFIDATCGQFEAAELIGRRTRFLLAEVFGEAFDCVEIFLHEGKLTRG